MIAGYEIERPLGRGGMGEVYLARKHGERRTVALKLLSSSLTADTRFQERFERESHMATSLEHPHIVPVYAIGEIEGVRFIAMRFISGPTLRELIDSEAPLDLRRIAALLGQMASALDDAHEIGLVHRDIKPANVLIARSGASEFREHVYLTDFGVSKYTGSDSGFTGTGQFVGTSLYGSPEQIRGEPIDGRADVYAFGCVLFECLTGRPPFERDNEAALLWAQMFEPPPMASAIRTDLTPAFDEVVMKAMAKSRGDRYETCGAVCGALREAIRALEVDPDAAALAATASVTPTEPESATPPAPETVLKPVPLVAEVEESLEPAAEDAIVASIAEPSLPPGGTDSEPAKEPAEVGPAHTEIKPAAIAPTEFFTEPSVAEPAVVDELVPTAPPSVSDGGIVSADTGSGEPATAAPSTPLLVSSPDSRDSETIARPAAAAVVASATPVSSPPREPTRTIVTPLSTETAVAPRPIPPPAAGGASVSGSELTVIEDRVPTRHDMSRRRVSPATIIVILLAIATIAAGLLWLVGGDGEGKTESTARPRSTAPPKITGDARAGEMLRARRGSWTGEPTSFAYSWQRCNARGGDCTPVRGADSATFRLTDRDVGRRVRVAVTATNESGARTTVSSATSGVRAPLVRPSNVKLPSVSGDPHPGSTLRAARGTWKGTRPLSLTYVWLRCNAGGSDCAAIAGTRSPTYRLTARDLGRTIRVEERVRNEAGKAAVRSSATPAIRGSSPPPPPAPPPPPPPPAPPPPPPPQTCPPVCPTG